jgi:hypothetical protein
MAGPNVKLRPSSVARRAAVAVRRFWLSMLATTLLLAAAPPLLGSLFDSHAVNATITLPPVSRAASDENRHVAGASKINIPPGAWVSFGTSFVCGVLQTGVLASLTLATTIPRPDPRRRAVVDAVRNLPWLVAISVVSSVITLAGFVVVVPGLVLLAAWLVGSPARLAESRGVWPSLARSAELTRTHRWTILGLLALWMLVEFAGFALADAVTSTPTMAAGRFAPREIMLDFVGALTGGLLDFLVAALYLELRSLHDGMEPEADGEIFG